MKLLHYFCLSLCCVFVFISCSKKHIRPPEYGEALMSKEEVIERMGGNVGSLKIIAQIDLEKAEANFDVKGSVVMKQPEMMILKLYKLGFPIFALSVHDGMVQTNSTEEGALFKDLSLLLYHSLMWWDGLKEAQMYSSMGNYHFLDSQRELIINGNILFPVHQRFFYMDKKIDVFYEDPVFVDNFWYPSVISVKIGSDSFTLEIKKVKINPPLKDNTFVIPS